MFLLGRKRFPFVIVNKVRLLGSQSSGSSEAPRQLRDPPEGSSLPHVGCCFHISHGRTHGVGHRWLWTCSNRGRKASSPPSPETLERF